LAMNNPDKKSPNYSIMVPSRTITYHSGRTVGYFYR